jgi:competence protein ComEA
MTKLLKAMLLAAGIAGLVTASAYAKEEPKQTSAKEDSKQTPKQTQAKQDSKNAQQTSGASNASSTASSKASAQIDINSASEKELASLPKIGEAKAKAIVQGRPYRGKDELVDKKILSQNDYNEIKDQIIAKQKTASADKKK